MTFKDLEPKMEKKRKSYFHEPQTEEEITAFEKKFNTQIPPLYRDFIKTYGGISWVIYVGTYSIKELVEFAYKNFFEMYNGYELPYKRKINPFPIGGTDFGDEFIMDIDTNEIYVLLIEQASEEQGPLITFEEYFTIYDDFPILEKWDLVHLLNVQLDSIPDMEN